MKTLSNTYSLYDWEHYLHLLGLKPWHIEITRNGFEANLSSASKNKPNLSDFTQVKGNWVRLSFKDVHNEKITKLAYAIFQPIKE